MNLTEIEEFSKKLCAVLRNYTWTELKELKINGQQATRIKKGEAVQFYPKTINRLMYLIAEK